MHSTTTLAAPEAPIECSGQVLASGFDSIGVRPRRSHDDAHGTLSSGETGMRFYSRLDDEQCQQLHEATLQVLERTGLIIDEPEGLELLRSAGAALDGNRVRIPAKLVDWALSVAPKEVTLYGRDGQPALRCGGYEYSFGAGSDCM
jgi:trimethylamine:corrinoid methyltransferase-like protein